VASYLQLGERVGVVSQTQGVEGTAGVELVEALNAGRGAGCAECLGLAHERHLRAAPMTTQAPFGLDRP
jgi:hypothetical protein